MGCLTQSAAFAVLRRAAPLGVAGLVRTVAIPPLGLAPWTIRAGGGTPLYVATALFGLNLAMLLPMRAWGWLLPLIPLLRRAARDVGQFARGAGAVGALRVQPGLLRRHPWAAVGALGWVRRVGWAGFTVMALRGG